MGKYYLNLFNKMSTWKLVDEKDNNWSGYFTITCSQEEVDKFINHINLYRVHELNAVDYIGKFIDKEFNGWWL